MSGAHKCQITFQNHKERRRKIIIYGQNIFSVLLWMWVTKCLKPRSKMPVRLWSCCSIGVGRRPSKMTSEMLWFWEFLAGLWFTCALHVKACQAPVLADLCIQLLNKSMWKKACMQISGCQTEVFQSKRGWLLGLGKDVLSSKDFCSKEFPLRKINF